MLHDKYVHVERIQHTHSKWGRKLRQTWTAKKYCMITRPESLSKSHRVVPGMWVAEQDREEFAKTEANKHQVGDYFGYMFVIVIIFYFYIATVHPLVLLLCSITKGGNLKSDKFAVKWMDGQTMDISTVNCCEVPGPGEHVISKLPTGDKVKITTEKFFKKGVKVIVQRAMDDAPTTKKKKVRVSSLNPHPYPS